MSEQPSSNQSAGWCNRCGGPLTSFERGSKLCANCEDEKEDAEAKALASGETWRGRTCSSSCGYCGGCT